MLQPQTLTTETRCKGTTCIKMRENEAPVAAICPPIRLGIRSCEDHSQRFSLDFLGFQDSFALCVLAPTGEMSASLCLNDVPSNEE